MKKPSKYVSDIVSGKSEAPLPLKQTLYLKLSDPPLSPDSYMNDIDLVSSQYPEQEELCCAEEKVKE
ncbi:hypothetical protein [Anaplasma platys]|uniref:hypothetical protein n=1 Tax=Anaplasma platys TaxID=949 RepID=UPI00145E0D24|nr:hypothetical protein [Anaplasma platys]